MAIKLRHPLAAGRQTDRYGPRGWVPGLGDLGFHNGNDWAAPIGTPIRAAHDGVVTWNGWDNPGGGHGLIIGGSGFQTGYYHMQRRSHVAYGTRVKAGQIIGYVGQSGLATGYHLHFMLWIRGYHTDPLPYITSSPPGPAPAPKPEKGRPLYYITGWKDHTSSKVKQQIPADTKRGLHINDDKDLSLRIRHTDGSRLVSGLLALTATVNVLGKAGTRFDLIAERGTWSQKDGWKRMATLETVRGVVDEFGKEGQQINIYNSLPAGQRIRIYMHPSAPVTIDRFSWKGLGW